MSDHKTDVRMRVAVIIDAKLTSAITDKVWELSLLACEPGGHVEIRCWHEKVKDD